MSERCDRCGADLGTLGLCAACMLKPEPFVLDDTLELQDEIGRGGMGAVYRAKHLRLGRTVAVKFLPDELAEKEEFRARFEREARALAMLSHPNIVTVHDVGPGYIVMEYVEGGPLSTMMPMPVERAVRIAAQVCDALSYAHSKGVVHRDIKPENILIAPGDRVIVTDFGIARIDEKGWTVTSVGAAAGTPHYLAPETLTGAEPDPRMDLYGLGVVLYQMVTGRLPMGEFEPAPSPLDPIIRRALAQDPERRYASAEEMKNALTGARGGEELEPHEELLIKGVASLQSISTAVALWTFVVSISPKVIPKSEVLPLIMLGVKDIGNDMVVTYARFETWWTLATLATFGIAITAYAFLRLHWRRQGLERPRPELQLAEPRWLVIWALVAMAIYGIRVVVDWQGDKFAYWPIIGGTLEVVILFFFWVTVLKAWRVSRPLRREPLLWGGFSLALIPPAIELYRFITSWQPPA